MEGQKTLSVRVTYESDRPIKEIDEIVERSLEKMGFTFLGCGVNLIKNVRDLSYTKEVGRVLWKHSFQFK